MMLVTATLFPSYTNPPARYVELRKSIEQTETLGAGNPAELKVFIAASIFDKDGSLATGRWGECVLALIKILGPNNVYLSIYENDAGRIAEEALNSLERRVECKHSLRYDEHLDLNDVEHVVLPDGTSRVKRVAYLSEARNRALLPLETAGVAYDRLLYLNDVVFDPIEAAQLLFLTNSDNVLDTSPAYRAACAVDFDNPIKYYDTFATRDYEGFGIGLPFFPWFTTAGKGVSRSEVLAGSDAVRVRSCWGGMVAFDASFFQPGSTTTPETAGSVAPANMSVPYHFRAEDDLYWDASECCLIHADIQNSNKSQSGIYMNPYVRTAYDWNTLQWLGFARRFERLYTPFHWLLSRAVGMPWYNPRRTEQAWDESQQEIWVPSPDGGSFQQVKRIASHSGFCGRRGLQLLKTDRSKNGKMWEEAPVPP